MPSDLKFKLSAIYNNGEYALGYKITEDKLAEISKEMLKDHLKILCTTVLRNLELQEGLKLS